MQYNSYGSLMFFIADLASQGDQKRVKANDHRTSYECNESESMRPSHTSYGLKKQSGWFAMVIECWRGKIILRAKEISITYLRWFYIVVSKVSSYIFQWFVSIFHHHRNRKTSDEHSFDNFHCVVGYKEISTFNIAFYIGAFAQMTIVVKASKKNCVWK